MFVLSVYWVSTANTLARWLPAGADVREESVDQFLPVAVVVVRRVPVDRVSVGRCAPLHCRFAFANLAAAGLFRRTVCGFAWLQSNRDFRPAEFRQHLRRARLRARPAATRERRRRAACPTRSATGLARSPPEHAENGATSRSSAAAAPSLSRMDDPGGLVRRDGPGRSREWRDRSSPVGLTAQKGRRAARPACRICSGLSFWVVK